MPFIKIDIQSFLKFIFYLQKVRFVCDSLNLSYIQNVSYHNSTKHCE